MACSLASFTFKAQNKCEPLIKKMNERRGRLAGRCAKDGEDTDKNKNNNKLLFGESRFNYRPQ